MPEKYVKRTNFWENLTPLDSSHLEVFLRIFSFFWIQIWILNLSRFGTGSNRNRAGPVWPVTVHTGLVNRGDTWGRPHPRRAGRPLGERDILFAGRCDQNYCSGLLICGLQRLQRGCRSEISLEIQYPVTLVFVCFCPEVDSIYSGWSSRSYIPQKGGKEWKKRRRIRRAPG